MQETHTSQAHHSRLESQVSWSSTQLLDLSPYLWQLLKGDVQIKYFTLKSIIAIVSGQGKAPMGSWTEQSQVVVETVTKTSTTQQFSAPPTRQSDASKVISKGAGLKTAMVNKETTFTVDGSQAGKCATFPEIYEDVWIHGVWMAFSNKFCHT